MDLGPRDVWSVAHVGLSFGITILVSVYGGYRLDLWLGTMPLFTVLLTLFGFFVALYHLYKETNRLGGKKKTDANGEAEREKETE